MTKLLILLGIIGLFLFLQFGVREAEGDNQPPITATSTEEISEVQEEQQPVLTGQLKRICACESNAGPNSEPRHYEADGITVLRGRIHPPDVGMCQINTSVHLATAVSLGFDVFTPEGNWGYASWLYAKEGTTPWKASQYCWQ